MRYRFLFVVALAPFVLEAAGNVGDITTTGAAIAQNVRQATDSLEAQAAAPIVAAVCSKRIAVLGELPEHGEGHGFGVKARVIEQLATHCGFHTVLFEAGSYDFFGFEGAVASARASTGDQTDSLDLALARALGGFWWTRELATWRRWLVGEAVAGRMTLGGIDDQVSATAAYAKSTMPGLVSAAVPPARATECQAAVTRYVNYTYTAAQPYDDAEQTRLADCSRLAADRAVGTTSAERRTPDQVMLSDLADFFARQRASSVSGAAAALDRDQAMAQHVAWWLARLPRNTKVVVWTATTHATRAAGEHPVLPMGVRPLGARLTERWGDDVGIIAFSALEGQWSRAGRPSQALPPLPSDALEARAFAGGAATDSRGWAYLDHAALRSLGAVPSRLFGKLTTTDWSTAFDGVLVIREEVAPTFEPRR